MFASDNAEYPLAETTQDVHKFALIIGVNNSIASSQFASLKYAEDDAIEVYRTLRQDNCGFFFLDPVLTGSKAGTAEVRSAIIRLVDEKTDRDFLLFYFIGHAQPMKTKQGFSDIYFVTHNFNPKEVKKDHNAHLSMRWLRDILYQPEGAGGVLIILDCCYAGNMIEVRPDPGLIQIDVDVRKIVEECLDGPVIKYQNGRLRVILTATGYNTPAQERVMTSLVLSALQGKEQQAIDDKGDVNIHSLYTYLQNQMSQEQMPNLSGEFARKCILAHFPEKSSDHLQQLQRAVEDDRWNKVSNLMNRISEVSDIIIDPNYFRKLAEANQRYHIHQFDRLIEEAASIADLNQELISAFLKTDLVQRQDDFIRGASYQDQLHQFGLLQQSHPTYGALLSFGMYPTKWLAGAFTRCTLWSGNDDHSGWKESQDYQRDLVTQFELSRDFLRKNLRLSRVIGRDDRIQELEIPLVALGEALANALVHREYANQTSPVYVDIFDDRVEISSPGVPPEPMSMELLQEEHKSHPRNPQIARIFYLYGYVEKVGTGIQRIQRSLEEAGLSPAQFKLGGDKTFKVIFYRPKQVLEDSAQSRYFYAKDRHMDSSDELISLLERSTMRLSTPSTSGTGFFVAPGLILTCAQIVGDRQSNQTTVTVEWENQTYHAKILRVLPSYPDLALLKLENAPSTHPCVLLHEAVQVRDEVYSYGYTKDYPHGDPASFVFEGMTGGPEKLLTFKSGRAIEGFSGTPLFNLRTGCVCGVLSITRGQNTLIGVRGIPTSVVLEQFKELVTLQKEFHSKDRQWYDLLPESEVKQFSWQELRAICSAITDNRMSTVRNKYSEELYLQREHAHQAFMRFLQDPTKRGFVLVGGSGVGKSNFLLAARDELQAREDVCMLMYDAGSLMEHPLMETVDEDFHEQVGWTVQGLWEKIKSIDGIDKRLVLFCVDALNEHEEARTLLKQLNELIQKPWPWLKVVIVSRPEAWQFIKRGVKLAEALYYREEGEAPGAISESFNYSERLEPFSRREELPLVYAKYQRINQVQTPYEGLSSGLREIISDPFNLWLVTKTYKTIPEHLKTTTFIEDYLSALTESGRLQEGDLKWLENQLVPLMVSEGHYERVITGEELDAADHALYRALLDRADSSGLPQLQSYRNLVDADILKREPRRLGFTIAFKYELFYDYFVGRRIARLSETRRKRT